MAGFDITPADPLQTQQDWRQSLAKTAVMESQARQQPGIEQEQKMRLQALMQGHADDEKFRAEAAKLSPDMPLTDRVSKLATLAFQTGKMADGEKLLGSAANIANRESQAAMRDGAIALKAATELEKKIKVYQSVEQMMGESAIGWEMGNDLIKAQTGEDHPLYRRGDGSARQWSADIGKALNAGHTKRLTGLQEQLQQARIDDIKSDNNRADRLANARIEADKALTRQRDERVVAGAKSGAGRLATVSGNELNQAVTAIRGLHPEADPNDHKSFAQDVAQDAKDILIREHGSYKDALQKAIVQNEKNWKPGAPPKKIGNFALPGTGGKSKYSAKGPSGAGEDLPTDQAKLVKGNVYKTPQGDLEFTGTGFKKPRVDTGEE